MPLPTLDAATLLGVKRAAHLLRRATFGATKNQIDTFKNYTIEQAITELFIAAPELPMPLPPVDPQTGETWVINGTTGANSDESDLQEYFKRWFIGQMMSTGIDPALSLRYSAREKIVLFLHTHFTAIQTKIGDSRALYFQNQLYRLFALDSLSANPNINIKELTVKVSVDNAMLKLLDGNLNVKGSPNENYGRELLELYSIGRGLEGNLPPSSGPGDYILYTEEDVRAAAKVLSGWDADDMYEAIDLATNLPRDPDTGLPRGKVKGSRMNASAHDNDTKVFSSRFNGASVTPDPLLMNGGTPTEESALDEIRQLINLIYEQKASPSDPPYAAKNICWKIYRFFAYAPHSPAASKLIDDAIITPLATTLVSSGYRILPVIIELLKSQHFYEAQSDIEDDNFGGIIKSPIDLVLGTYRFFNIGLPTTTTEFYSTAGDVLGTIQRLGMNFYEPYDVAGYEAYHQFPIYHRFWITPNTLANRYAFARDVVSSQMSEGLSVNVLDYVIAHFNTEASAAPEIVKTLALYLFPQTDNLDYDDTNNATSAPGITAARLAYFKLKLLDLFTEAYWTTNIWGGTSQEDKKIALERLFNAMLQSPEYQLA